MTKLVSLQCTDHGVKTPAHSNVSMAITTFSQCAHRVAKDRGGESEPELQMTQALIQPNTMALYPMFLFHDLKSVYLVSFYSMEEIMES